MIKPALLTVLLASACLDAPAPDATMALATDTHFVGLFPPYTTPEDCLAHEQQPFSCLYSLSLCKNGHAGERRGDLLYDGGYHMVGSVAHIVYKNDPPREFDLEALVFVDSPNQPWIVDTQDRWNTLQFDNVSCEPYPK